MSDILDVPRPIVAAPHFAGTPVNLERFSTAEFAGDERVELWEQHNARALIGLECRTLNEMPLEAVETNVHLSQLQFAHVVANAHVVERSSRHIATQASDGVALYFTLFGESFFYHRDGVHILRPGDLLVCDVNEPFMRGFATGLKEFVIRVPKALFDEVSDEPVGATPTTMRFAGQRDANAHARSLAQLLKSALTAPKPTDAVATEAEAIHLLHAMFSADPTQRYAADRHAAESYISRNLRDPQMSVVRVAEGVGVSERQLYRAFNETGASVAKVILDRRLDLAHCILTTPGSPSIGDVAAHCGFLSHAHFSRVFRERFDATPAAVRAEGPSRRS
ncbi:AraC family transcriptional regulator [Homoserinimonas aerilata]|uniref:AraC family transcriptional regulator n=1 Tax=Homoserinimonas aerilata TaxID=1162970 RepID=A0A542YA23_9MICO|nr:helix-turn-helix domain-containing protein [Homoserinimonas aerilata]TQL44948.1 AraC family transcriptional regulator [Homoserinimonas aerilata]